MASPELQSVLAFLRTPGADPNPSLAARRAMVDAWAHRLPPSPQMRFETVTLAGHLQGEWAHAPGAQADRVVLYFHGGGFTMGSAKNYRDLASRLGQAAWATVLTIDYRLAPENSYPAGLDDCVAAYRWLLARGTPASQIVLAGDSAGAGLVLSCMLRLRADDCAMPAAAVCISPFADMTLSGESMVSNAALDPIVRKTSAMGSVQRYIPNTPPTDPLVSPVFADFRGFPPLLVMVGSDESLLDDSRRVAAAAQAAGVDVVLEVWEQMFHIWPYFAALLPEGQQAVERAGAFIDGVLGQRAGQPGQVAP